MKNKHKLISLDNVKSPVAEAYRTLRTNILFSKGDQEPKVILFTSTGPGEGKSTTVANTAIVLAQSGKKVIVLDCDLRKPVQHKIFRKKCLGLTNVLVEDVPVQQLIVETGVAGVQLIPSGPVPPNPSELLSTKKMRELLDYLRSRADYILIDAPPIIAVTDACVLASKVDGICLVLGAGMARPEMARQAKDLLLKAQGHILGVILNRVEVEEEHAYYYYYYGSEAK
jgi:capsular exopolysaccharide synthesis family protein